MHNDPPVPCPNFRFVLGTRIQKGTKAHKKASCKFHDPDLARQGRNLKTMTQEGMQMVRKSKTILADRLR